MATAEIVRQGTFEPESHLYRLNGSKVPSVTQVLKSVGIIDDSWFTEHSAWRGSVVHMVCQLEDEGDLDEASVAPEVTGYLEAWRRFKLDTGFVAEVNEEPMFSTKLGFAGTPDRIGTVFDCSRTVVDLKSGAVQKAARIQLAAYQILADENGYRAINRVAVQLKPDGKYRCSPYDARTMKHDRALFLSALAIHKEFHP